uniref:Calcium homeostasis modulator family member 4 n=1 Tax=Bubo bubo TaxID=30461 RepID=A0A8C0FBI3_BUBBB
MDGFQAMMAFFMNRKTAVGYSFMVLLTMGGERVFSLVAFRCPCSNENFRYGLAFLFFPAFVLLIIGYFMNCKTGNFLQAREYLPFLLHLWTNHFKCSGSASDVALLNGTFYECAMSGVKNPAYLSAVCHSKSTKCFEELHKVACDRGSMVFPESDELKRTLQAQSQILGWCAIATTALLSLLTTCCASCQSKVSHLQLLFWRVYAEKEKEQLDQIFKLYATKLSKRNLQCFFENKEPEEFSLPDFQEWEAASQLYSFSSSKQHYITNLLQKDGMKLLPYISEKAAVLQATQGSCSTNVTGSGSRADSKR